MLPPTFRMKPCLPFASSQNPVTWPIRLMPPICAFGVVLGQSTVTILFAEPAVEAPAGPLLTSANGASRSATPHIALYIVYLRGRTGGGQKLITSGIIPQNFLDPDPEVCDPISLGICSLKLDSNEITTVNAIFYGSRSWFYGHSAIASP